MRNTFMLVLVVVPLQLALALGMAMMLQKMRARARHRAVDLDDPARRFRPRRRAGLARDPAEHGLPEHGALRPRR